MVRREYTQTVQPVSRIPEKIFGWLAWLSLLVIGGFLVYSLLVTINDPNFSTEFERQINENPDLGDLRTAMTDNNLTIPDLMNLIETAGWWIGLYFLVPLILGLIGLFSMKKRILAGIMMLLAGLTSLPLFVFFWIPLFFLIAAILLFARKDKVIMNQAYDEPPTTYERHREATPVYVDRDERIEREKDYTYNPDVPVERTVERDVVETNRVDRPEADRTGETLRSDVEPRETVIEEQDNINHNGYYVDTENTSRRNSHHIDVETDRQVSTDENDVYDRDRVKYVDRTIDATEERRRNYNERMNRNNENE